MVRVNEWLQWCCYDHWRSSEFGFEICTFLECGESITVTCFLSWEGCTPLSGPVAVFADGLMKRYRDFYTALAHGEPTANVGHIRDVLGMRCQIGDWGRTDGSDTGAYPPYRYEGEAGFFHIDLLHPEDDDQGSP